MIVWESYLTLVRVMLSAAPIMALFVPRCTIIAVIPAMLRFTSRCDVCVSHKSFVRRSSAAVPAVKRKEAEQNRIK
jgi:hypothetical protein